MDSTTPSPIIPGVEFRTITDAPGYCVGDNGSVWSKWTNQNRFGEWHRLRGTEFRNGRKGRPGYLFAYIKTNGKRGSRSIHRLILEAFVGPCPSGMEARHLNGDPHDNRPENLMWGTKKQNADDMIIHGTRARGSRQGSAKLNEETAAEAIRLHRDGWSFGELAAKFGVRPNTMRDMIIGRTWRHVPRP